MDNYSELLKSYITNSELSLREISRRCESRGTPVSQAYISKLLKEDVPPASEDINRALAEVTGGDPDKLVKVAYIERAPLDIKELLQKVENLEELITEAITTFIEETSYNNQVSPHLKKYLIEKYDLDLDNHNEQELNWFKFELQNFLELDDKLAILATVLKNSDKFIYLYEEEPPQLKKEKNDNLDIIPIGKQIKLPVIGVVKAGPNGLAYEEPLGEESVDEDSINGGKYFWLKIKGDSMTGDGIFEGDLVLVREQPEVENGQLGVVIVDGEEGTLKRIFTSKDSIVLQSSSPSYPPRVFTGNDMKLVRIVGRAKEIKRKL
ncbi:LexA family protein [Aneurinibacillus aneurinilyticus]|uniref:LexA family protein n=1 Tax=Aneurinibacillus aneurinilyticus TaxID=1391 RepID=UPI0023F57D86|nr:S24 family peptidase [Aneurinibacillus aneurinilyticus]